MNKNVIVDTSAIIRLYIPDGPIPEGLEEKINHAINGELNLLAPELLIAEFNQVLLKKERAKILSTKEVNKIRLNFDELPILFISHKNLINEALDVARAKSITIYDALFFALACQMSAQLITADEGLRKKFTNLT